MFQSFSFNDPATTEIYTLSLHDALPIYEELVASGAVFSYQALTAFSRRHGLTEPPQQAAGQYHFLAGERSEEHTSELQSRGHLVCRLLLEKKKKQKIKTIH